MNTDGFNSLTSFTQKQTKPTLWADHVPLAWKPYVQLTRIDFFLGSLMIFWPCMWGLSLVGKFTPLHVSAHGAQIVIWLVWSILLHSYGSTWNDICDVDFDRQVARTKNRPLPSGTVSSQAAFLWMCPQVLILVFLLAQFNQLAMVAGLFQMFFLTLIYPFMKRITYFPQVWLGFTLTWSAVVVWSANSLPNWPILAVILATGTIWVTYFDTLYAMLDKEDDPKAGIKSTALLFGDYARLFVSVLAILFIAGLTGIGYLTQRGAKFYLVSVLGAAVHLAWQIWTVDFEDPASCTSSLKSNGEQLGGIIWVGLLID
ncbi:UbiA prenyltransferase family-domain-containing protein [Hysterangium stoloniferum]|nr:UbiA prenyltransferase family-domain-containing protein [Hysterangium stoloniferum]